MADKPHKPGDKPAAPASHKHGGDGGHTEVYGHAPAHKTAEQPHTHAKSADSGHSAHASDKAHGGHAGDKAHGGHADKSHIARPIDRVHPTPPSLPRLGMLTQFMHKAAHEGEKLYHKGEKFVGKLMREVERADRISQGAEKLSPQERARLHIKESTDAKTHRYTHYDDLGRIDHIKARNKTEVNVHYKPGSKGAEVADFAVVNNKQVLDRGESSKNKSIKIDQHSGEITSHHHEMAPALGPRGEQVAIPVAVETHNNPDGIVTSTRRDFSGRRLDKVIKGPDNRDISKLEYQYHDGANAKRGDHSVTARQYGADNKLKHTFEFETSAHVEKQDPRLRTDHHLDKKAGVVRESRETYDLHKDGQHPINKCEKVTDFKKGTIVVSEQNFDGLKQIDNKVATFDEMARPVDLKYQQPGQNIDVSFGFDKNGKADAVSGHKGKIEQDALLRFADLSTASTRLREDLKTLDHGELLSNRGPNTPRAGDKPNGAVAYKEGDKFVQHKVKDGVIYDDQDHKIGTVKDDGQVQIGDTRFNINSDDKRAAVFSGTGSDGRYLDLTNHPSDGSRPQGFNGYITNGTDRLLVVGDHVFAADKNLLGALDASGKMVFAANQEQSEKENTALTSLLHGKYQFSGSEDGKVRDFSLDRTSHGQFFLPPLDSKGQPKLDKDGMTLPPEECEVRLGMLINKRTGEQIAKVIAPVPNQDGTFSGGEIEINGRRMSLASITNASFKLTVDGEQTQMRGAVLGKPELQADGTLRPGTGLILDVDATLKQSQANKNAKQQVYDQALDAQRQQQAIDGALPLMGPLSAPAMLYNTQQKFDNASFDAKTTALDLASKQYESDRAAVERMMSTGQVDANTIFKLQKMGEFARKDNQAGDKDNRELRLKDEIDHPVHILENVASDNRFDGKLLRPDLDKPGLIHAYDVRDALVYKKGTDVVVGNVNPANGTLNLLDASGRREVSSLTDLKLKGTSLHLTCTDNTGATRNIEWVNDGTGHLQSLDQLRKQVAKERAYAELIARGTTSGEAYDRLQRTRVLEERYKNTLDDIARGGVKDAGKSECGFTTLEILRGGPREFVRAEHDKPGRHYVGTEIHVPPLNSDEMVARTSGPMRIGHGHFYNDHGKLYRTTFDASKKEWVPVEKPCGRMQTGYRAEIDGKSIDLQSDGNFLFKMHVEGEDKERWIMGLGAPQRDASGRLVSGGLIDAKELVRSTDAAHREISAAAEEYDKNQSWGPLGWAVDRGYFSGREDQLNQMDHVAARSQDLLHRQLSRTFNEGLDSNTLATQDIEHNVRSMQSRLTELNLTAQDAGELSRQGQQVQSGVREGAALAVTTVLTGGVSTLVAGGSLTVMGGVGICATGGALSSALVRQTKGADWEQTLANTGGGGLEALVMFGGGNLGAVAKNFSTVGKSGEIVQLIKEERSLHALQAMAGETKLYSNLQVLSDLQKTGRMSTISTGLVKELAANPEALKLASMIGKGEGAPVKALCELLAQKPEMVGMLKTAADKGPGFVRALGQVGAAGNAFIQSSSFSAVNALKTGNLDELKIGKLVEGGTYMYAGELVSSLAHVKIGPSFHPQTTIKGVNVGQFVDGMITSYPDAVVNNSVFSALTARANGKEVERQNIAADLHMDKDLITDELFEKYKNENRMNAYVLDAAFEGAATTGLSHPFTHMVTHSISSRVEANEASLVKGGVREQHEGYIANIESKINAIPEENFAKANKLSDMQAVAPTAALNSEMHSSGDGKILNKITRDEHGSPVKIEPFAGAELVKDKSGWSLYYHGREVQRNAYTDIKVLHDGTVVKEGKSHIDGLPLATSERADGSMVSTRRGLVDKIVDATGHAIDISRDSSGEPVHLKLSAGAELVKTERGWDIVVDHLGEHFCKDIKISSDGTVQRITDSGVVITNHLDGSRDVHAPGDHIGLVDYHLQRQAFERNLASVDDPLMQAHLRDGLLDVHDRLSKNPETAQAKMGQILYDVNRLLVEPGLMPLEMRHHLLDQALNLAANPDFVSQGQNPTCALAASEQRLYALHPEMQFKLLRRLHEMGEVVSAGGDTIVSYKDGEGKLSIPGLDRGARHSQSGTYSIDGQALEVNMISQAVLKDTLRSIGRGDEGLVYARDLEPMMKMLTGLDEKFVVAAPKDAADMVRQLAEMKKDGMLYAIVEMDASHLGAGGLNFDRGHARIVKDIRTHDRSSDLSGVEHAKIDPAKVDVIFGNTWNRSSSNEVMSAHKAYETTLAAGSEKHIEVLLERALANAADPVERLELLSWKIGMLNSALVHQINGKVDVRAENVLHKLGAVEPVDSESMAHQLIECEAALRDKFVKREERINGKEAAVVMHDQINDLIDGYASPVGLESNLTPAERRYLSALGGLKRAMVEMHQMEEVVANQAHNPKIPDEATARGELQSKPVVTNEVRNRLAAMDQVGGDSRESNRSDVLQDKLERLMDNKMTRKIKSLYEASGIESLTGFANVIGLMRHLTDVCREGRGGYLLSIDVRRFKQANDCMGRQGADDALRYITRDIARVVGLKPHEILARTGGDEIVLHLDKARGDKEIERLTRELEGYLLACRGFEAPVAGGPAYGMRRVDATRPDITSGDTDELLINLAIGVVKLKPGDTPSHVIERGDALMNERKQKAEKGEEVPPAFLPDYDVAERHPTRSHGQILTLPGMSQKHAPERNILDQMQQFDRANPESRDKMRQERHRAIEEWKGTKTADVLVRMEKADYLMSRYENLPPAEREKFRANYEAQCDRFENMSIAQRVKYLIRLERTSEQWLNAQTSNAATELCQRYLRRYADPLDREFERDRKAQDQVAANKLERFAVIKVDIDNMKIVNDEMGHHLGNDLLNHAATYLRARLPHDCLVASPGGAGFTIIVPNHARRIEVEKILKEYGELPADTDRAPLRKSLYVPDITLPQAVDPAGKKLNLKFGFSYGSAEYEPREMINRPKLPDVDIESAAGAARLIKYNGRLREHRDQLINEMVEKADKAAGLHKLEREAEGTRMPRIPKHVVAQMEWDRKAAAGVSAEELGDRPEQLVFKKSAPPPGEDFHSWRDLLKENKKNSSDSSWVRPEDTSEGPLLLWRRKLREVSGIAEPGARPLQSGFDGRFIAPDVKRPVVPPESIPNVYRQLIRDVSSLTQKWETVDPRLSPADQAKVLELRLAALQTAIKESFEKAGIRPPRLRALSREEMEGAYGEYLKGKGVVCLDRDTLLQKGKFEIDVLGHEAFGHHVQEHLVANVQILDRLRSEGRKNLDGLVIKLGPETYKLTAEGFKFCKEMARKDPTSSLKSLTSPKLMVDTFLAGLPWIEERLERKPEELLADSDYVAGQRYKDSFAQMNISRPSQMPSLINLSLNRRFDHPVNDYGLEQIQTLINSHCPKPPEVFDGKRALDDLLGMNEEQRYTTFGYDPFAEKLRSTKDKDGNALAPRMDVLFDSALANPEFFKRNPDFYQKIIDGNTALAPKEILKAKNEWLDMVKAANPGETAAGASHPKAVARLELLAYKFARDHFENGGGPLGNLTREQFESRLPDLMYKLISDNVKIAYTSDFARYLFSLHEQRARHVQDVFKQLIATGDTVDRPEAAHVVARDFNNGRALIPNPGKDQQHKNPKLRSNPDTAGLSTALDGGQALPAPTIVRRLSLPSKDLPEEVDFLKGLMDQVKANLADELLDDPLPFEIKENSGIPEGYMPSAADSDRQSNKSGAGGQRQDQNNGDRSGSGNDRNLPAYNHPDDQRRDTAGPQVERASTDLEVPDSKSTAQSYHAYLEALRLQRERKDRLW